MSVWTTILGFVTGATPNSDRDLERTLINHEGSRDHVYDDHDGHRLDEGDIAVGNRTVFTGPRSHLVGPQRQGQPVGGLVVVDVLHGGLWNCAAPGFAHLIEELVPCAR